ncbi:MAG TPA: tetratricopeptide repeat protein, partial [Pseudomonadales bacterium]|nr:tetratricopeptide repeat protein [Pseudomonadales bacterium]
PVAMGRLGTIYFEEGRLQKAAPYLYNGCQLDTNNLDLHLKLAQIYLAVGMVKEAHSEAGYVLDRNTQDHEAPVFFAQSVKAAADADAAQHRLGSLAQNNGDNAGLETGLGMLAARQHDFKTALADLQHALNLDNRFAPAYAALGNVYLQQDEAQKAESAFKAAADCAPLRAPLRLEYGQFEIQSGNFTTARSFFEDMTKQAPDYIPGWLGLAEVSLDEKKLDDSSTALDKALATDPDNADALVLQARLNLAKSDVAKATDELEHLAKLYRQAPRIHYQLALAYIVGNQRDKALNQLHEAADLDPNLVQASFLLAQLELQTGDTDSAVDLLKPLVVQRPNLVPAELLLAEAYRLQKNFSAALEICMRLENSLPKDPQILVLTGTIYAQQQNSPAARQEFSRALEMDPDNADAQEGLAELDFAGQQYTAARDRIQKVIAKHPQQALPQVLLAKIYLAQAQTNQAEIALLKAAELPDGAPAYLMLAQLYCDANQDKDALDILNMALTKKPKDASALMLLGVIQTREKNYQAAADAYEKLLAINPQYGPALNNLACLYSDNLGDLNKAYDLAQRAHQLFPNDASAEDTLGWVFFRKGDYVSAVKLFQDSAIGLAGNPEAQFHLGIAHYMLADEEAARQAFQGALSLAGDFPERSECQNCLAILNIDPQTADAAAQANLEKRISEKPNDPVAFTRLTAIYQRDNNSAKTIALCEAVLQANPNNFKADILLAQLLAPTDPPKAFRLAKSAYQLKPDDTQVRATLGRMAFLNGNDQWAFNLLEQAAQDQPGDAQIEFDFANAAFCVGKMSQAQTAMQSALQGSLPPAELAKAQNFTNVLLLCQNPQLAIGSQDRVSEILSSTPNDPPALFADAIIQAQQSNPMGAERDYEKLLSVHPNCALAQKNLAILYAENLVEPDKAYPVAVKAREAFPDDPQVAKALALILFQRGDYSRSADLFTTISGSDGADAEVFYYLGICEFHLKNRAGSKTSLQHALNLNLSGQQATDARQTLAELNN